MLQRRMQDLLDDEEEQVDELNDMTAGEKEALEFYDMMRKRRRAGEDEDSNIGV